MSQGEMLALYLSERMMPQFSGSPFKRDLRQAFAMRSTMIPGRVSVAVARPSDRGRRQATLTVPHLLRPAESGRLPKLNALIWNRAVKPAHAKLDPATSASESHLSLVP
jgi:hypothetical protein